MNGTGQETLFFPMVSFKPHAMQVMFEKNSKVSTIHQKSNGTLPTEGAIELLDSEV